MDDPRDDDLPFEPARPDSHCAYHPEREALVHCPMCDSDVCFGCFFPEHARCQRCIERHPDEVAEPVPLEAGGSLLAGFARTVLGAFRPRETAPSFALGDGLVRPFVFLAATFLPLAALRGVIPYTHRVHFGSLGAVVVSPGTGRDALIADVLSAALLSVVELSVELAALTLCYASLAGAFGRQEAPRIALRTVAYRAFLLPLGGVYGLAPTALAWLGPPGIASLETMLLVGALPTIPFFLALHRSARTVGRVDALPGLAVALVPWVLVGAVALLGENAMRPFVPDVDVEAPVSAGS